MPLHFFSGPNGALNDRWRRATGELPAIRYLAITYPDTDRYDDLLPDDLVGPATASARGLTPAQVALYGQAAEAMAGFGESHALTAIFARTPGGGVLAPAAMRTIRGTRPDPIARTIGEPTSSIPTHRVLRRWRYRHHPALPALTTPETALAEFGRLSVATRGQLRRLVAAGTLTPNEADWIRGHALDAIIGGAYARDQTGSDPPRAYIFNTQPLFARLLRAKGLPLIPLYLDGAEPTPLVMESATFDAPYFQRWPATLAALVPPDLLRDELAEGVRELVRRGFARWHTLPINLPYLLLNNATTARAMRALSDGAMRRPGGAPALAA